MALSAEPAPDGGLESLRRALALEVLQLKECAQVPLRLSELRLQIVDTEVQRLTTSAALPVCVYYFMNSVVWGCWAILRLLGSNGFGW